MPLHGQTLPRAIPVLSLVRSSRFGDIFARLIDARDSQGLRFRQAIQVENFDISARNIRENRRSTLLQPIMLRRRYHAAIQLGHEKISDGDELEDHFVCLGWRSCRRVRQDATDLPFRFKADNPSPRVSWA